MTIGAIVVCRFDSKRLPGKVLADIAGKPLLWYVLTRCFAASRLNRIIVATSDRPVDDPILEYCASQSIAAFRGSANNVAARMLHCAEQVGLDYFFRINGDSPCVEPSLLDLAVSKLQDYPWDFITNLYPRSFPYGISVELISTATYRKVYPEILDSGHLEHATQYLYQNLGLFRWQNILRCGEDLSQKRLTIDTSEDLVWFRDLTSKTQNRWATLSHEEIVTKYSDSR